jgi:hypothetical protein
MADPPALPPRVPSAEKPPGWFSCVLCLEPFRTNGALTRHSGPTGPHSQPRPPAAPSRKQERLDERAAEAGTSRQALQTQQADALAEALGLSRQQLNMQQRDTRAEALGLSRAKLPSYPSAEQQQRMYAAATDPDNEAFARPLREALQLLNEQPGSKVEVCCGMHRRMTVQEGQQLTVHHSGELVGSSKAHLNKQQAQELLAEGLGYSWEEIRGWWEAGWITVWLSDWQEFRGLAEATEGPGWQREIEKHIPANRRLWTVTSQGHGSQLEFDQDGGYAAIVVFHEACFQVQE